MVAIDTNILVRLFTRDDETQYQAAYALFQREDIYIPDSVILETEWVLRFAYDFKSAQICSALRGVFGLKNVVIDDSLMIARVIEWYEKGLDFGDALHLAKSEHLSSLKTFDERYIKHSKKLSSCKVTRP